MSPRKSSKNDPSSGGSDFMTCAWKVENAQLASWSLRALVRPRVMGQILRSEFSCRRAGALAVAHLTGRDRRGRQAKQLVSNSAVLRRAGLSGRNAAILLKNSIGGGCRPWPSSKSHFAFAACMPLIASYELT